MAHIVRACYQCDDEHCAEEFAGGIDGDEESQESGLELAVQAGWIIDSHGKDYCPTHAEERGL